MFDPSSVLNWQAFFKKKGVCTTPLILIRALCLEVCSPPFLGGMRGGGGGVYPQTPLEGRLPASCEQDVGLRCHTPFPITTRKSNICSY